MNIFTKEKEKLQKEIDDIIKDLMSYGYSKEEMIKDLKDENIWNSDTSEEVKLNYIKLQAKLQTLSDIEAQIKEKVGELKHKIQMAVESGYIDEEQFEYEEVIDEIFGDKLK